MSLYTDRLKIMEKNAPDQVGQIEASISQVENQIDALTKEKEAIDLGMCKPAQADATDFLETTVIGDKGGYMYYGPTYGTISWSPLGNLTDWEVRDSTSHVPIYTYTPGDYTVLDGLVEDYEFGNDYLTRPPITGASYGIIPKISSLTSAANILNENADKVAESVGVFNKYAT